MKDFEGTEKARARSEAAHRTPEAGTGSRQQSIWSAMMRYLSGELDHEKRAADREGRKGSDKHR
jgi:hypothetical protein